MGSPLPSDPYKALNVPKDATTAQIKAVYRKLVLTCHPDKVQDESAKAQAADRFHQVQQAYEILSDEQKRKSYDDRVKLAELRANILKDVNSGPTPGLRRAATTQYAPSPNVRYEMRGDTLYEERAPRYTSHDDSDYFRQESAQKYDERYAQPIRRNSTRGYGQEDRKKARDREFEVENERMRERATKAHIKVDMEKARNDRRRDRDRDRRKDDRKRFAYPTVDSESEESDSTERFMAPKKTTESRRKYEEPRRERREDLYRRRSSREESDSEDDLQPRRVDAKGRIDPREEEAESYIRKMGGKVQRPSLSNFTSHGPQPPTPPLPMETPKRSSAARTRGSTDHGRPRSSGKDRSFTGMVESRDYDSTPSRRPHLSAAATDPPYVKHSSVSPKEKTFPRAATFEPQFRKDSKPEPRLQRSATQPNVSRHVEIPIRSSKLKPDYHDSGYSSPGTPEYNGHGSGHSPYVTTKTFRISESSGEDDRPRVVLAEPNYGRSHDRRERDRERDVSPRGSRLHSDHHERPPVATRTSTSSNVRSPQVRSSSFAHTPEASPRIPHPSSYSRHGHSPDSGRPPLTTSASRPRQLYGEINTSPAITSESVKYAHYTSPREGRSDSYVYADTKKAPELGRGASYRSAKVGS